MSQMNIVTPIATSQTRRCIITAPWFVQNTEYAPAHATFLPLVNGEAAFKAVHEAIAKAKKTVDIVCWGFQPSMYFIRDGSAPRIGELLSQIAQKNVQVRILGWEAPLNAGGVSGEANLPGKGPVSIQGRAGQSATDEQYAFDCRWFKAHAHGREPSAWLRTEGDSTAGNKPNKSAPVFVSRGFGIADRVEIAYEAVQESLDDELSKTTALVMAATPSHHQKTVLVDFELPEHAVGFVMGHNMLDEYWDTDSHSARGRTLGTKPLPNAGARGFLPRQDISCRVTGPILKSLHDNFATAWQKETGRDLLAFRNAENVAKNLKMHPEGGTRVMAQLLRTQAQADRRDIEALYLKAVNNATQFIYIENQYFRWPPLAEVIKKLAATQVEAGRCPEKHGALYLFVVTNASKDGIGPGTVNTQRMLESLGRADGIPEVTKKRRVAVVKKNSDGALSKAEMEAKIKEIEKNDVVPEARPGLKIHVCSLVAQDSPPQAWMPVYIHSKLMIVNDVFTTLGSANINTRSMQVDSEINIAHENAKETKALRQKLWQLHTNGLGGQDDPQKAFEAWEELFERNKKLRNTGKSSPEAPLINFLYNETKLRNWD